MPPQKVDGSWWMDPQVKLASKTSHTDELCLSLIENPSSMKNKSRAGLQPWVESLSLLDPLQHSAHLQRTCRREHEPQLPIPVAKKGLPLQARRLASLLSISPVMQAG